MDELYIGLMSGTSTDGVNAVLVDFRNHYTCLHTHYHPYPVHLRDQLISLMHARQATFSALLDADHAVALAHVQAVRQLLSLANIEPARVRAIGFHGQTIFHQPGGAHPNSLQIGNAGLLAERTGISTVSDFRRRDMAVGGQGAPFAPAFHEYMFRKKGTTRAIVNIGGIANITILPGDRTLPVSGFDTGPGNCLLDEWYSKHHDGQYDDQGNWARTGSSDGPVLNTLLAEPYFQLPAPKSTGREVFHLDWLQKRVDTSALSPVNLQATLCQLTCVSIASAALANNCQEVFVCGGGVHNDYLMSCLVARLSDIRVSTTEAIGLPPDWVEASAFAWFAKQRLDGNVLNLKSITGADRNCVAGAIYK